MNVCFCPSCRSLILADFRYCPYCGAPAAKGPGLADALSGPFEKLGAGGAEPAGADMRGTTTAGQAAVAGTAAGHAHSETGTEVFASLKESLDRLEAEMDLILGELEKEGSSPS